jgi:hypothetical protein
MLLGGPFPLSSRNNGRAFLSCQRWSDAGEYWLTVVCRAWYHGWRLSVSPVAVVVAAAGGVLKGRGNGGVYQRRITLVRCVR